MTGDVWGPLWLSLRISLAAIVAAGIVGIALAYAISRRPFAGRSVVEAIVTLPLVLPPTVVGYLLILALGARGWIGRWLHYSIVFRIEGAVLAAAVVALPMVYMPARAAFADVDRELEDIAQLFGATRLQRFWHVSLPLARRGIASGLILGLARALGEFGATLMVFGYQPGRATLPLSIYSDYESGELTHAAPAVVALIAVSLGIMFVFNRSSGSRQRGREG